MKKIYIRALGLFVIGLIIVSAISLLINVETPVVQGQEIFDVKNFGSYSELTSFLESGNQNYNSQESSLMPMVPRSDDADWIMSEETEVTSKDEFSGGGSSSYSDTNVQVQGVDEPDIVKTDGTYLYIVSNNKIIIIKAYPAENADIISEISLDSNLTLGNIFISGTKLVVFAESYQYPILKGYDVVYDEAEEKTDSSEATKLDDGEDVDMNMVYSSVSPWYSSPDTYLKIYDLENISSPYLLKDIVMQGSFTAARMIDGFLYVITTQYSYRDIYLEEQTIIPTLMVDDDVREIPLSDIYYIDLPEKSSTFTNILSVNLNNDSFEVNHQIYLFGTGQTIYVSKNNIYVSYSTWYYEYKDLQEYINNLLEPILPENIKSQLDQVENLYIEDYQKQTVTQWILQKYAQEIPDDKKQEIIKQIAEETERTIIHKISIDGGKIEYISQGNIPGYTGNQFSFSEENGYLYVSTTLSGSAISSYIGRVNSSNNVFVLNQNLTIVGSVNDIAIGENIYATRFIGTTCYLVTFRQIDPFYVIDLSNPTDPEILGWLKIPGYSTYLHPYDTTHIIGIGKEDSLVKLTLFDVSDMQSPVEIDTYLIEDKDETDWYWTDSSALYEHKAFLFDKEKNLLVIPIGNYYQQSAYVFNINLEGFDFIGFISHDYKVKEEPDEKEFYYWYDNGNSIQRSLYIDDVLYTLSTNMIKMNSLEDLSDLNSVLLV